MSPSRTRWSSNAKPGAFGATIEVEGLDELHRAMRHSPRELRRGLTKAMRLAAVPARGAAAATIAWSRGLTIRARQAGAAVGSPLVHPPIIEFGNRATIGEGGKVAPHVRKLNRQPALVDAVESQVLAAREIADRELAAVLERVLAASGALRI